jgi:hypothetical protein
MEVWSDKHWVITMLNQRNSMSFHTRGNWFGSEVEKLTSRRQERVQFQSMKFTHDEVVFRIL